MTTSDVQGSAQRKGTPVMFKSLSTSLILRGILAVAVGITALAWPQVTVLALVILFAVYAFIAAGVVLFARPGVGAVTLALLFGLFNLVYGARTLVQGIELRRTGKTVHSAFTGREKTA